MDKSCAIVIPAYKTRLTPFEKASYQRVRKVLGLRYDIFVVHPFGLDLTAYALCRSIKMPEYYFKGRKEYSDLLKNPLFYSQFHNYEYVLIYQLDSWVFEDRLQEFIRLGYDYIGAPHCQWMGDGPVVGNGGLSLRRVKAFEDVCTKYDLTGPGFRWEEDRAFTESQAAADLNIAPLDVAFRFSVQDMFEEGMKANGWQMPFGTHQPDKFWPKWKKYIQI